MLLVAVTPTPWLGYASTFHSSFLLHTSRSSHPCASLWGCSSRIDPAGPAGQRALPTQVSTRGAAAALPGGVCFQHCSGTTWRCRSTASPLVVEREEKTPALHRQTHRYLIGLHRGLPAGRETKQPCYRGNRTAAREAVFPERQVRNSPC